MRGGVYVEKPTGLAYSRKSDTLWVLTYTQLINMKKDGTVLLCFDIKINGQDQLFLNKSETIMYFTAGTNYEGTNYVYSVDLSSFSVEKISCLADSCAVEGIYFDSQAMYILNDGYYHSGKYPSNQVNIYILQEE